MQLKNFVRKIIHRSLYIIQYKSETQPQYQTFKTLLYIIPLINLSLIYGSRFDIPIDYHFDPCPMKATLFLFSEQSQRNSTLCNSFLKEIKIFDVHILFLIIIQALSRKEIRPKRSLVHANERMDIEINDYPGSGANSRHDPRNPGRP